MHGRFVKEKGAIKFLCKLREYGHPEIEERSPPNAIHELINFCLYTHNFKSLRVDELT